jgi:hypothetical protein
VCWHKIPCGQHTGLIADSRSHIAFTDTGAAGNQYVFITVNEGTVCQAHDLVTVDTSAGMIMNVLYRGFIAELGILYLPFDTPVLPVVPFCIYQGWASSSSAV